MKWAKERLRICLLKAPRFTIVTVHKLLVPLFNKVKAKVQPRIKKWIMEMQDILSRHPLPEKGHDKTEKIIRWNVDAEHAVVVTRIREETKKDEIIQRLAKRIAKGDLETHKRDKDLEPYLTSNRTTTSTSEEGG